MEYSKGGDYEFGIEYTDLADWKCNKEDVNYGDSVAPTKFTIDKIASVVTVTFDNNNSRNGNYYKADRTATIVVIEHNLEPNGVDKNRAVVTMTASDDGQIVSIPNVSERKTDGDTPLGSLLY